MKKRLLYKDVKIGESYYFVHTDFRYPHNKVHIMKARVNKKITGYFTTRNEGDRFEVVRVFGHSTLEDANREAIRDLKIYKKSVNREIDLLIKNHKDNLPITPKGK